MKAESLISKAENLKAPSPTVIRLLTLLNNPNADFDEVIATVARDSVLSAKLLALCNSASYGLAQPVASIEQAVYFIGYCEVHRLVMGLNFGGQIGAEIRGYAMEPGALWRHALMTALLTPRVVSLSRKFGADTSIAYTAGLLHDIGKLVIGQVVDFATCEEIHALVEKDGLTFIEAERAVLGCDHAEVGGCLLRRWRIPEVIVEAVAGHHEPPLGKGPRLSAVVRIADAMAHQVGASPGWVSFAVAVPEEIVPMLGLTEECLDTLVIAAFEAEEKICRQERCFVERPAEKRMAGVF